MTILNKERRAYIIQSVYNSTHLPVQKKDLIERTQKKVREIVKAKVPSEFFEATKNLPAKWFDSICTTSINREVNPVAIVTFIHPDDLRNTFRQQSVKFDPFPVPRSHHYISITDNIGYATSQNEDPKNTWEYMLQDLIKEAQTLADAENKMRTELMNVLLSVNTYKRLLEVMPELERHLPAPPVKHYPVAAPTYQLNKMLDKLGFDTGVP